MDGSTDGRVVQNYLDFKHMLYMHNGWDFWRVYILEHKIILRNTRYSVIWDNHLVDNPKWLVERVKEWLKDLYICE